MGGIDTAASPARPSRRLALVAISVLAGGWLLCSRAADGVDVTEALTAPPSLAGSQHLAAQFRCVDDELHRLVPEGAAVAVRTDDVLWQQRLTEFAFRDHRVVPAADEAEWILTVTASSAAAPAPAECGGIAVVATAGGRG
jgi:hypothetical protein